MWACGPGMALAPKPMAVCCSLNMARLGIEPRLPEHMPGVQPLSYLAGKINWPYDRLTMYIHWEIVQKLDNFQQVAKLVFSHIIIR
jgi:hypothetical protein